ncbi:dihydrofolate reductase isoform X3 [Coturnix japonica]|uniref:Dihydrofolate reductase n=1 Tax=Coturnix japonica TaxID=93934 RepID=A0A8C2SLL9_COTJA|nr:dihydrofolate reductase isoform X3 [Coturnix japonica]
MVRSLNSIVAVCQNMGIGKDGNLPWPPLRNEYKYFQRMTSTSHVEGKQNALIMGKKTWFSIPEKNRPLKDRINIVLSRELKEAPKGAHYLSKSLDDALALLDTPELKDKVDMVWIVGGTSVYKFSARKVAAREQEGPAPLRSTGCWHPETVSWTAQHSFISKRAHSGQADL